MRNVLLGKKERKIEFSDMTAEEKEDFLACDMIERMIRVEQKVRASVGEGALPYFQTTYFKELPLSKQEKFSKYLKSKERQKKWRLFPTLAIPLLALILGVRITGNVISDGTNISSLNLILLISLILLAISYVVYILIKKRRKEKLEKHFKVVDNILYKRRAKKSKKK